MRKSLTFFLVNLILIVTLAQFDDKTSADNVDNNSKNVNIDIEDGV